MYQSVVLGFLVSIKFFSVQALIFDEFDVADRLLWSHEVGGLYKVYTVGVHRIGQKMAKNFLLVEIY